MKSLVLLIGLLFSTVTYSAPANKLDTIVKPLVSSDYAQTNIKFYLSATRKIQHILYSKLDAKSKRVRIEKILQTTKMHGQDNAFAGFITSNSIEKIELLIQQYRFGEAQRSLTGMYGVMNRLANR